MAENTPLKRLREETEEEEEEILKRQKSFKDIISLLEDEEDEPNQDYYLSSLISTLQDEISSGGPEPEPEPDSASGPGLAHMMGSYETDDPENPLRHLLEASDDELGIPNTEGFDSVVEGGQVDGGDLLFPMGGEGLWEFEDHEAANYYSLLQSEIFL